MGVLIPQWEVISSQFILRIVQQGYRLEFSSSPSNRFYITELPRSREKARGLLEAIGELMEQKVVSYGPWEEAGKGFYSHVFVVQKPSGKFRLILNLQTLKPVSNLQKVQDGLSLFCKGTTTPKLLYCFPGPKRFILKHP